MAAETNVDKIRENRLRRMAERQGLQLQKSRRRDPRATEFGTYQLLDRSNDTLAGRGGQNGYGMTLDEVERALS
jgi:hypothetical protein